MAADSAILQIHSSHYKNPEQLPPGAVLVVGAGSSGAQIAEELRRAGRKVFLSISKHLRRPRWYRGRDYLWWVTELGLDEAVVTDADPVYRGTVLVIP